MAAAHVDVLDGIEREISTHGLERFYADIDEQLAKIVGKLCQNALSEDKLKDKMAAYVRPANCPALAVTKVNPLILGQAFVGHPLGEHKNTAGAKYQHAGNDCRYHRCERSRHCLEI